MIKNFIIGTVSLLSIIITATIPLTVVYAQTVDYSAVRNCESSFLGLPTWYKYLELNASCDVVGPIDDQTGNIDWRAGVARIGIALTEILLRVSAVVAVGFVMYGGFRYITSQGEPDSVKSARQTIQNSIIGLVISLIAAAIVSFIGNSLG